jgi:hypothetical protein
MRYGAAILVLLTGTLSAFQSAENSETARLTFIVSTTFGEPLERAQVVLTSIGPKQRLTGLSGSKGEVLLERVPFGLYEVEARVPGFEMRREKIGVYQQQLVYRLGLVLGYPHSAKRSQIAGSVSWGSGSKADLWVRLVSVFGGDVIENAVDRTGSFHLIGMAPGRYVLILFDKEKVLATKPVEVLGGSKIVNFSLN